MDSQTFGLFIVGNSHHTTAVKEEAFENSKMGLESRVLWN